MTCAEFEDLILDEMDGRIGTQMQAALQQHLTTCEACRGFVAMQSEVDRLLAAGIRTPAPRPLRLPIRETRVSPVLDVAAVASVAAAAGTAAAYLLPPVVAGAPWMIAAAVLCAGSWITLLVPQAPSA